MMMMMTFLDCDWEDDKEAVEDTYNNSIINVDVDVDNNNNNNNNIIDQEEELSTLISKESGHKNACSAHHRREAVEWILAVVLHYSFRALTAVLAVDYLDRFLDRFQELEKPWITQLAAVSCLSLAAKVEQPHHLPLLLLDLQLPIDGSKYIFEAKTVQKMEILILSTLEWKMNPVTPLSFVDYVARRLGLKRYISSEFINRCKSVLLCFLPDERYRCHLPSVIATATMVHVINSIQFQSQLLGILGINKEEVEECEKEIQEATRGRYSGRGKRKFGSVPGSPDDVTGRLSFSSSDESSCVTELNPSSVSSSPEPGAKKSRKGAA